MKKKKTKKISAISLLTLKVSLFMEKKRREKQSTLTRTSFLLFLFASFAIISLLCSRALQEAQDIFGVDFDYEDFEKEGEEYEEDDEEEEYEDEEGVRKTRKKTDGKIVKKKSQRKTIYDVYEPSELERGHFTDFDEQVKFIFVNAKMTS